MFAFRTEIGAVEEFSGRKVTNLYKNGEEKPVTKTYSDKLVTVGGDPVGFWVSWRKGHLRFGHDETPNDACLDYKDDEIDGLQFVSFRSEGGNINMYILKYVYYTMLGK